MTPGMRTWWALLLLASFMQAGEMRAWAQALRDSQTASVPALTTSSLDGNADKVVQDDQAITLNAEDQSAPARAQASQWSQWYRMQARKLVLPVWQHLAESRLSGAAARGGMPGVRVAPVAGDGSGLDGLSLWLNSAPSSMRSAVPAQRGKGFSLNSTLGLDMRMTPDTTLGISLGHSYMRTRNTFMNGRERTFGLSAGPYFSHAFNDWLSVDAQAGYVHQWQKLRRRSILGVHRGKRSSNGYVASAAINASRWLNAQVMMNGRLGMIASRTRWKGYVEQGPGGLRINVPGRKEPLVQGVAEAGISYWAEPVMPYLKVAYTHDLLRRNIAGGNDRDDFTLGMGITWYGSREAQGLVLGINGSAVLGRRHQRHYAANLSVRWAW